MIFRIGIYLAVGALLHLVFVGQHFDFQSALTWLWLFGWPMMLLIWGGAVAVVIAILALAVVGARRAFQ